MTRSNIREALHAVREALPAVRCQFPALNLDMTGLHLRDRMPPVLDEMEAERQRAAQRSAGGQGCNYESSNSRPQQAYASMVEGKRTLEVYDGQPAARGHIPTAPAYGIPTVNPHTGRPYSAKYYDILSKRRGALSLPRGLQPLPANPQPDARTHASTLDLRPLGLL